MLEIQNVSKTFNAGTVNQKTALNGLNLKLNEGDFVTVIGGNGAGKSTMLNAVAGVWPVDEGKIIIDGVDVTRLSEHQRAAYIGRVFQDPMTGTAATMQIEENLALAARRGKPRTLRDIERECWSRYGHADTQAAISARLREVCCYGWVKHSSNQVIDGKQVWHYRIELSPTTEAVAAKAVAA